MPDNKKISELPPATAAANSVVPVSTPDGSQTVKVTLGEIAALGGGEPGTHTHTVFDINNLTNLLNGKAPLSHNHVINDIIDFPTQTSSNSGQYLYTDGSRLRWGTVQTVVNNTTSTTGGVTSVNGETGAVTVAVPTKTTTTSELTDFPSQTGNTGLFLQTNGTTLTWASATGSSAGVDSINGQTGAVTLTAANLSAAAASHSHTIAQVTNLQGSLNAKSDTGHTHRHQDITNFPNVVTSDSGRYLRNVSGQLQFANAPVQSDVSQGGAGSVSINNIVKISSSSYDSLVSAGNVDSNTLYIIV